MQVRARPTSAQTSGPATRRLTLEPLDLLVEVALSLFGGLDLAFDLVGVDRPHDDLAEVVVALDRAARLVVIEQEGKKVS